MRHEEATGVMWRACGAIKTAALAVSVVKQDTAVAIPALGHAVLLLKLLLMLLLHTLIEHDFEGQRGRAVILEQIGRGVLVARILLEFLFLVMQVAGVFVAGKYGRAVGVRVAVAVVAVVEGLVEAYVVGGNLFRLQHLRIRRHDHICAHVLCVCVCVCVWAFFVYFN